MVNSTSSCAIFIERLTIAFKIIQEPLHIYTMYSIYNIYVVYIIYNTYKNNIYICDIYINFKAIDNVLEAKMVSKANLFIKNISLFFYRSFVRN